MTGEGLRSLDGQDEVRYQRLGWKMPRGLTGKGYRELRWPHIMASNRKHVLPLACQGIVQGIDAMAADSMRVAIE